MKRGSILALSKTTAISEGSCLDNSDFLFLRIFRSTILIGLSLFSFQQLCNARAYLLLVANWFGQTTYAFVLNNGAAISSPKQNSLDHKEKRLLCET